MTDMTPRQAIDAAKCAIEGAHAAALEAMRIAQREGTPRAIADAEYVLRKIAEANASVAIMKHPANRG